MTDSNPAPARLSRRAILFGVAILALQLFAVFGTGIVAPVTSIQFLGNMFGPLVGLLLLLGWWTKVVPNRWVERLMVIAVPFAAFFGAFVLSDPSAQMWVYLYGVPLFSAAFVVWAAVTLPWIAGRRRLSLVAVAVVTFGVWTLVRSTGVDGDMGAELEARWTPTAEERFLESEAQVALVDPSTELPDSLPAAWPGLRGPGRDSVVHGVRIATDWTATPPEEIWHRQVGPGWSSFAIAGDRLFTQEQRGDDEVVVSYLAATGEPVWVHADAARFWEALAGAGPRATPTFHDGKLFTLGATGLVNALDATAGTPIWRRNLVDDTGAPVPDWGFTASPLVVNDLVVIHGGAPDGKAIVAYDRATGEPRWFAPAGPLSYSSVHEAVLGGERQLLFSSGDGLASLSLDGQVLWQHDWPLPGAARIVQPAITEDGDVLIGTSFGAGLRRIHVAHNGEGWDDEEVWTTTRMNPYYNDLVLHRGHAYGFDGRILACVDLATGERVWKGGRYGNGQLLLLADQDLLLVVSDRGDVALVEAKPDGFNELTKIKAINGKTWNHPALADGVLYVRNAEEMAALRLPGGG